MIVCGWGCVAGYRRSGRVWALGGWRRVRRCWFAVLFEQRTAGNGEHAKTTER